MFSGERPSFWVFWPLNPVLLIVRKCFSVLGEKYLTMVLYLLQELDVDAECFIWLGQERVGLGSHCESYPVLCDPYKKQRHLFPLSA